MTTPVGATHFTEFYGKVNYYRATPGLRFNSVIDHPVECWQKITTWHVWENERWVSPGSGWSPRRLQSL